MSDLPSHVSIREEGPREGFQIEPPNYTSADKVALIEALAETGIRHIQAVSFVNPRVVPGWADAEEVVRTFRKKDGVDYTALWFSENGLKRALAFPDKLTFNGAIILSASEAFSHKNLNRGRAEHLEVMRTQAASLIAAGVTIERVGVMAAFGCNYQGDISPELVIETAADGFRIAEDLGIEVPCLSLADSMGWTSPERVERLLGAIRSKWPDLEIILHLHDTRGLGIASAYAGLRMGVSAFDSCVAGLGGCPFAGQKGAVGNIASEELVLLCHDMGIETGIDLEALIETGRLAEKIIGRPLPSTLLRSNSFDSWRRRAA